MSSRSGSDEEEEVLEYKCRKCPGKTFTAAEKDTHRMYHRDQKEKEKKKPGPKSRTRGSTRRDPSPTPSGVTLFEPVTSSSSTTRPEKADKRDKRTSNRRKAEAQPEPPARGRKKSKKHFDDTLIGEWKNGNGA
ncbi:unnamed protein product [Orchesella dallaii]|uniref:C2H2-type domain-containing protein n=1 Tax=Orchesella dallaii TaxID=48710 RepID=A0ABP1PTP2_9HEXA